MEMSGKEPEFQNKLTSYKINNNVKLAYDTKSNHG